MMRQNPTELMWRRMLTERVVERVERTTKALERLGFQGINRPEDLVGKVLAINVGTFHHDFVLYPVKNLIRWNQGYTVEQDEGAGVIFGNECEERKITGIRRSGIELFLPNYLIEREYDSDGARKPIFVGGEMPKVEERNENSIGWLYPPKKYRNVNEIRQRESTLYDAIVQVIEDNKVDLNKISRKLKAAISREGIDVEIETRTKKPESLYAWLHRGPLGRRTDNCWDINGVRVLAQTPNDCYRVLEIAHDIFPGYGVRDTVAVPKPNGFQSLVLIHRNNIPSLEIQVQTPAMKAVADAGTAANYRQDYQPGK